MAKGTKRIPKFVGVYFYESEEKRHQGKPDKCFYITYNDQQGKKVWEKIGWQSEGYTAVAASQIRGERVRAIRHGDELPKERTKKDPFLSELWEKYDAWLETNKKKPRHDRSTYNTHLKSRFADKRLSEISPFDLEKVKIELSKTGRAASTIKHVLVLVRQLFNKAIAWGMWEGKNPIDSVKLPTLNNDRVRFLTVEEAERLLNTLEMACPNTMMIALLSLHTGMRAGEIFNLRWQDVNFDNGIIRISDPKGGKAEIVYMTKTVKEMLEKRSGEPNGFVFVARDGGQIQEVSKCYFRAVERLELNKGISDHLQRVNFHTLRHTFASWLAIRNVPLYTIQRRMRHKSITMTQRYAHLMPDHERDAVSEIEKMFDEHQKSRLVDIEPIVPDQQQNTRPSCRT